MSEELPTFEELLNWSEDNILEPKYREEKFGPDEWPTRIYDQFNYARIDVPSSQAGKDPYQVLVTPSTVECTCPGYMYREECKHQKAVRAILEEIGARNG